MLELTNPQYAFYGVDRMGAGQTLLLCGSVLLPRNIPEAELQRAANEIFRINEGLRTRFVEKEGKVYQEFKPYREQTFKVLHFNSKEELDTYGDIYGTISFKIDIRREGKGIPKSRWMLPGTSLTLVKNVAVNEVKNAFKQIRHRIKTVKGCCEIQLVYLPDSCGAIVKMHHCVSDAWTMLLVANQFIRILNGETPEAYKYEEYVKNVEEYKKTKRYIRDRDYFEKRHALCPEPTPLWPYTLKNLAAERCSMALDKDLTNGIKKYAEEHGTSGFIVFLAAMSVYMMRKLDRDRFYVGSVVINRNGIHELNTAGMFINSIPLLVDYQEGMTFADAIQQLKDTNLACFRHERGCQDNDLGNLAYDIFVSYQNATLDADPTAVITQYYCQCASNMQILTVEDRSQEGCFKLHFDHNLQVPKEEVNEVFRVVLAVLHEGLEDDGKKLTEMAL